MKVVFVWYVLIDSTRFKHCQVVGYMDKIVAQNVLMIWHLLGR